MRYLILTLLFVSTFSHAEIYKTINPDGSVSFSDKKSNQAETVSLPKLVTAPALKLPKKKKETPSKDIVALPYKAFTITSPKNNATIFNNNGNINLSFKVSPGLQTKFKHKIVVSIDGKVIKPNLTSKDFQLTNIDRGTHKISAKLVDASNKTLKSSQSLTIFLKRRSILHPKPM